MKVKLKCCPFCGGMATVFKLYPTGMGYASECLECGAKGPTMDRLKKWHPMSLEESHKRWNRRTKETVK